MKISIITLFPKMISGFFEESIVKRAIEKGVLEINLVNLRDFAVDEYGSVDDRPYGGGAGMVLRADVIHKAISNITLRQAQGDGEQSRTIKYHISKRQSKNKKERVVLTSAKGKVFNQDKTIEYSKIDHLIIISGHYEGVDERVLDFVDEEISLGDFVLTGGEIAVSAIVDSIARLLPGVLKKEEASRKESFFEISVKHLTEIVGEDKVLKKLKEKGVKTVTLLEYPHYTRPEEFQKKKVPDVLLSGDHKKIEEWRLKKAYEETLKKRPDLLYG
ncbi:tRNA (guanine(37)-N(1))-methyltransferase [Candidatus Roizmanbacteria bacterium]|nr:tRNA (guanine(37)-N(1))-methyltransferase [Candidatus Roizmanbacteria bacterium]